MFCLSMFSLAPIRGPSLHGLVFVIFTILTDELKFAQRCYIMSNIYSRRNKARL